MRALLLAALLVASFATVASAGNDGSSVPIHPDSSLVTSPNQTPLPAPEPVVAQPAPAPAPAPAPVVATPWPENVPSLKPGTGSADRRDGGEHRPRAPKRSPARPPPRPRRRAPRQRPRRPRPRRPDLATQNQVASLPPQQPSLPAGPPVKVTLQAAILAGAPPLREPLQWTVSKPGTNNKKIGLQVASMTGPRGEFSIPPGDYVVTVKQREAVVSQPLTVGSAGDDQDAGDQYLDRRRPDDPLYRRQDRDGAGALGGRSRPPSAGRAPIRRSPMPWRRKRASLWPRAITSCDPIITTPAPISPCSSSRR